MLSSAWSQSGHFSGWGSPRRARRSEVQQRLCATSHRKKRHLAGAQVFQILSHGLKRIFLMNKLSYADLAEYCPLFDNFQVWESSTSGCNSKSWRSQNWKYSTMTPTVIAPWMSEIQVRLVRACCTVCNFLSLRNHSKQSRREILNAMVMKPPISPEQSILAIANIWENYCHWTKFLNLDRNLYRQCRPRAVWLLFFCNQSHLARNVQPRFLRSEIPKQPSPVGEQAVSHTMRQCPPHASLRPLRR
jgi:hypothetical protein